MGLVEASKILRRHLNPFIQYADLGYSTQSESGLGPDDHLLTTDLDEQRRKLEMPVSSLDLSVRAQNCLEAQSIQVVGALVKNTELDLLKVRNFGKTTLGEIKTKLREFGLALGMEVETSSAP